jgi:aerobic-type carbon monoxide dehydrogenase small subunit (CoxS/CutS family)
MTLQGTHESTDQVSDERRPIAVVVNGEPRRAFVEPRRLLSDFLRHDLGLTGTHVGCEHGVCGACTVLVDGEMLRSCLAFAVQVDGAEIETVEGMDDGGSLSPIQRAFREKHGLQCGFCTPGMLLSTKALLAENPDPSREEIREFLSGNVCRCTGYVGIVDSVEAAAEYARTRAATTGPFAGSDQAAVTQNGGSSS